VRQDERRAWQEAEVYHSSAWRAVRFKEVSTLYWRQGSKRRALRLLVIAPTAYRNHKLAKTLYRQPDQPFFLPLLDITIKLYTLFKQ
jgi:hypothetical protein